MRKLGLIAGGGALPVSVAARCEAEGRPVFVVRLAGFADVHLARYPGLEAGMAEFGKILSALKKAGCTGVCFAGTVSRPDFKTLKPDLKGATLLPGIIAAATKGDGAKAARPTRERPGQARRRARWRRRNQAAAAPRHASKRRAASSEAQSQPCGRKTRQAPGISGMRETSR